jgi:hypothetical protein
MGGYGLSDDGALRNIFSQCSVFGDQKRFQEFANLFAESGQLIVSGVSQAEGPDAIHDWLLANQAPAGRHFACNVRVDVNGDQGSGDCSFLFVTPDNRISVVGAYQMRFVRVEGGWRIEEWRTG